MRFKKTEVCQTCAKLKNVCQTCLLDLEYGKCVEEFELRIRLIREEEKNCTQLFKMTIIVNVVSFTILILTRWCPRQNVSGQSIKAILMSMRFSRFR